MSTSVALIICAVLAAIAIPLALRLIGPNSVYGFRTPVTRSDLDVWYSANAFAGWALLVSAGLSAALVWFRPAWFDLGVFTNLAAIVLPSAAAVIASLLYLRNLR
jgi:uncharacterized membrane protein